ncbi:hypothetical protein MKZ38_009578 [Zalerion maritima]|uniref:Uncharacterized protein n=1 Tax=Zalerion maritima TaxID=339359 RepID=A0AAD5WSY0_9PEZI|nr:hypothetical protein MKZ38_009578 [Zalerion maritima]
MPGPRHSYSDGNRRFPARVSSGYPFASPPPTPGHIMWLPSREELDVDVGIPDGCRNHPVLILSPHVEGGEVVVLIMTSFGGKDLAERHSERSGLRQHYLPIEPSRPHPDNGILLRLDELSSQMQRSSYVQIKKQYTIAYIHLRECSQRRPERHVLSKASYRTLCRLAGYTAPSPAPRPVAPPVTSNRPSSSTSPFRDSVHPPPCYCARCLGGVYQGRESPEPAAPANEGWFGGIVRSIANFFFGTST